MKKFFADFKNFAIKGNVIDMAVGVIIGGAFTAIVTSLVNNIIMPLLSLLTSKAGDIAELSIPLGEGEGAAILGYGSFISAIINFLLISLVLFLVIRLLHLPKRIKPEPVAKPSRICPYCRQTVDGLATRCPHCTSQLEGEGAAVLE
ncbi:MAG: large conductance mechanosensitive channel protein MscL [Christensenellales bacterium]|jgi:large conductance mechanosensitive channel